MHVEEFVEEFTISLLLYNIFEICVLFVWPRKKLGLIPFAVDGQRLLDDVIEATVLVYHTHIVVIDLGQTGLYIGHRFYDRYSIAGRSSRLLGALYQDRSSC